MARAKRKRDVSFSSCAHDDLSVSFCPMYPGRYSALFYGMYGILVIDKLPECSSCGKRYSCRRYKLMASAARTPD